MEIEEKFIDGNVGRSCLEKNEKEEKCMNGNVERDCLEKNENVEMERDRVLYGYKIEEKCIDGNVWRARGVENNEFVAIKQIGKLNYR
jgi:hypothetical protein